MSTAARLGSETKYVDGYYDSTTVHELGSNDDTWADTEANPRQQTAVYGCLPVPRQGTNYADRDGRKIIVKKIRIKGQITWLAKDSGATLPNLAPVRIVIVRDKRTNGTELSGENVLGPGLGSDGQASLLADCGFMALSNPDGWGRYEILFDKVYKVPASMCAAGDNTNALNTAGIRIPFNIVVKPNCEMNFNASTGAVGSIVDNSFHVLAAAGSSSNESGATFSYVARTSFIG